MLLQNEVYHAVVGQVDGLNWWARSLGDDREGHPAQVSFDPDVIYKREDDYGDIVGFYHTHPNMPASPSITDYRTMGAWCLAFGRPLLCMIEGADGLKAHWFVDDETDHVTGTVSRVGGIFVGNLPDWDQKHNDVLNRKIEIPNITEEDLENFEFVSSLKEMDWDNDDLFYTHEYVDETSMFDTDAVWTPGLDCFQANHYVRMPKAFLGCVEMQEAFIEFMYDRYPDSKFWSRK